MKKLLRNKKGFTLIELIVVILILAILAAILVPAILNYVDRANHSKAAANARSVYSEVSVKLATGEAFGTATANLKGGCSITDDSEDLDSLEISCPWRTGTPVIFDGEKIEPEYTAP